LRIISVLNSAHPIIRATAFFLLLLFTISAVPKMYFHSAMVHHQDIAECSYADKSSAHIDKDGFNCDIDQQLISFPFLGSFVSLKLQPVTVAYPGFAQAPVPDLFSVSILSGSRGPPNA
jgi:hypothetical protein